MTTPSIHLSSRILCAAAAIMVSATSVEAAKADNEPIADSITAKNTAIAPTQSEVAATLQKQFAKIPATKKINWTNLMLAVPNNSKCMGALVTIRLLMSDSKVFKDHEALKTALKERLTACGLDPNFVTEQATLIKNLWDAYQNPNKSADWALPFITDELEEVKTLPNLPAPCKTVIESVILGINAAQAITEIYQLAGGKIPGKIPAAKADNEPIADSITAKNTAITPKQSEVAATLQKQFATIPATKKINWTNLMLAVPNNSKCMGALVTIRLLMSGSKVFKDDEALKTALKERLTACGLDPNFVTEQATLIKNLWDAYQNPNKSADWALPFITSELQEVTTLPNLPAPCKTVIESVILCINAAQAITEIYQLTGGKIPVGGCCS